MKLNKDPFLTYRILLRNLARINRNNPTRPEEIIWNEVLRREKTGYKFLRQKPIANFILDFYCAKLLLAIEIDGDSHIEQKEYDDARTDLLNDLGVKVIRYDNLDVIQNIDGVYKDIIKQIDIRIRELKIN